MRKSSRSKKPIEPVYQRFGERIKQTRIALWWSQAHLAKKVKLSRGSIANIETGRQRMLLWDVERFAQAFQTTPKHLLRGIWT